MAYKAYVRDHAVRERAALPYAIPPAAAREIFERSLRSVQLERDGRGELAPFTLQLMRLSRTQPELFRECIVVRASALAGHGQAPTSMGDSP
jgi:hypothetical protein